MKKTFIRISVIAFLLLAVFAASSGVASASATSTYNFQPQPTQTPGFFSCTFNGGAIGTCIVFVVTLTVSQIMGVFVSLGALVVKLGLSFNQGIYNSPFIQNGFGICLSIANLGFVLAIIIIAIATILRSESYGYKKALWRLIAMAILVNFGLVITAPIVSFADSITTYFLNTVSGTVGAGGIEAFVDKTTGVLQPQALLQTPSDDAVAGCVAGASGGLGATISGLLPTSFIQAICTHIVKPASDADSFSQMVLALVFNIIFLFFIALALFAIGVLFFVRYAYLTVLLVLLPFAWLAWIFPKFGHEFSKWWSTFIKWTFFAPAAMFFIYLALLLASQPAGGAAAGSNGYLATVGNIGNAGASAQNGNTPEAGIAVVIGSVLPLKAAEQDFVIIALMLGGLMAASSLTGKAGSFVVEQAKGVSNGITGYAGRKTKNIVGERLRTAGRRTTIHPVTGARETTTWAQRVGSRLQAVPIPGAKALGSKFAKQGADTTERTEKIEKYRKDNLTQLDNAGILTRANSRTAFLDPTEAAAVGHELARRNIINQLPPALQGQFLANAERMGNVQTILNNRPELAAQTEAGQPRFDVALGRMETAVEAAARAIRDAVRTIKNADIPQLDSRLLDSDPAAMARNGLVTADINNVVLNLNPSQLGAMGASGDPKQQRALTETIRRMVAALGPAIMTPTGLIDVRDPATGRITPQALTAFPPALRRIVEHMDANANWDKV